MKKKYKQTKKQNKTSEHFYVGENRDDPDV